MKIFYSVLFVAFFTIGLSAQSNVPVSNETNSKSTSINVRSASSLQPNAQVVDLPGFPVMENTGNAELDKQNYLTAKANWIKENQVAYDAYMSTHSTANITNGGGSTAVTKVNDLPGFPVYVNTGNAELDKANYSAAKELWISNNQELYNKTVNANTNNNAVRKTSTK